MRHWSLPSAGLVALLLLGQSLPAKEPAGPEPTSASQAEIDALIAQLGAGDYRTRQRAQTQLSELGAAAFDALAAAQGHKDLEIATRARFLLGRIRITFRRDDDPTAVRQLLKSYAAQDEEQRQVRIGKLAELAGGEGLAALCRLARYESSEVLSKRAAIQIITQKLPAGADRQTRAEVIQFALGPSQRAAARWLRAYSDVHHGEPQRAAEAWATFTEQETQRYRRSPQQTDVEIVIELLKYRVRLLDDLKRGDDALTAFRQLFDYHPTGTDRLVELITWVRERRTWAALDELERRFDERLRTDLLLLYALATAREAQGKTSLAEELAKRALAINQGDRVSHFRAAVTLGQQGMFKWSEREYRYVIGLPPADNIHAMVARYYLGELLHDQEKDEAAGKIFEEAFEAMKRNINNGTQENNYDRDPKAIQSRMHYFFAMHSLRQKDVKKHVEHLDKALESDPADADALIALYRLPAPDKVRRDKTLKGIESAVETFRKQIKEDPDSPTPYNQLAWLVGNTAGDYQEALRCSQKSLELRPNSAAYLDTLGRCYYAVRDYHNAVKHQRMAVELDPHALQLRRQLELFETAAAEAGGLSP